MGSLQNKTLSNHLTDTQNLDSGNKQKYLELAKVTLMELRRHVRNPYSKQKYVKFFLFLNKNNNINL